MTKMSVPRLSVAMLTALAAATPAAAQDTLYAANQDNPYAATAALGRDRATTVSVALLVAVGSRHDPSGYEGTALLLAQTLAAQANTSLVGLGGDVTVSVERSATRFTVTALPSAWREAWAIAEATVFDRPIDPARFEREHGTLSTQLTFSDGSPVSDFERESVGMLAPPADPWARPPFGTVESRGLISARHAELLRADLYSRTNAVVAIVGDPSEVDTQAPEVDQQAPEDAQPAPEADPSSLEEPGPSRLAWLTGDRILLTQEVTSAWISVAYPLAAEAGRTVHEFIAHLVRDALDPDPPDPERYSVDIRIVDAPDGPVLVAEAAVLPEAADRWESRIVAAVGAMTANPPAGEFFEWERRRFRSIRLLEDAPPASAAARIAADLQRDVAPRDLQTEMGALTPEAVAQALVGMGETRIFRLGPDLGLGSGN